MFPFCMTMVGHPKKGVLVYYRKLPRFHAQQCRAGNLGAFVGRMGNLEAHDGARPSSQHRGGKVGVYLGAEVKDQANHSEDTGKPADDEGEAGREDTDVRSQ